jgi:adenylate kinase
MKTIIVSGSVGTGKTKLSKKLSKALDYEYIDVSKLIKEKELSEGYDSENKCEIVNVGILKKFLVDLIKKSKKNLIIDSHMSHYLPKKYVDLCIITTCDLKVLKERLKKRKYSVKKIKENLEAEIFDTCLLEAKENKHNILIVNTTKGYKIKNIVEFIENEI